MRLNKIFWAWKLQIRQGKVNRLKRTIIEHKRMRGSMKAVYSGWKRRVGGDKQAIRGMLAVCEKRQVKVAFAMIKAQALARAWKEENTLRAR